MMLFSDIESCGGGTAIAEGDTVHLLALTQDPVILFFGYLS